MYGADADELDRLAAEFDRAADQLDRDSGALSGILNNVSWLGDTAGRFLSEWTGFQLPKIGLSTTFLRDQARELRRQAADQRRTSSADTGSATPRPAPAKSSVSDADDAEALAQLADFLKLLGVAPGMVAELSELLEGTGLNLHELLEAVPFLRNDAFVRAMKGLDAVLDIGSFVVDVMIDFAQHPHLPFDERAVHAVVDAGIRLGISKGADIAVTAVLSAAGSIVPVLGTAAGAAVGKAIGFALSTAIDAAAGWADDRWDFVDGGADAVVAGYKVGKSTVGAVINVGSEMISDVIDVGGAIVDGIGDVGGAIVDGIGDVGGAIVDGIGDVGRNIPVLGGLFR